MEWYWWCLIGGGDHRRARRPAGSTSTRRCSAVLLILEVIVVAIFDFAILADPGPQGLTGVGFDPSVAIDAALGAALVVLRGLVRRLRVGGDLQRGEQGPQADGRAGDVHRGRRDRRASTRSRAGCWRTPSGRHDRRPGRARRGRLHDRRRARPDDGPVHRRPGPPRRASGATRRRCCSAPACSRRCSRSTTRSPGTSSRSGARACSRRRSRACNARTGAPFVGSAAQSVLALTVVARVRDRRRGPGAEALHVADEPRRARRAAADGG